MKKQPKVNKSELFKRAWTLFRTKNRFKTFSECLKHSWKIARVVPSFSLEAKKHSADLFSFALSLCNHNMDDANDLFQETMLNIYKGFHNFNPEKSANENGFKWWAMTAMKNTHINMYRHNINRKKSHVDTDDDMDYIDRAECTNKTDGRAIQNDLRSVLDRAMSTLKPKEQKIIKLWSEGYKYEELADMFSMPINTIKIYIYRAKENLSKNVEVRKHYVNA